MAQTHAQEDPICEVVRINPELALADHFIDLIIEIVRRQPHDDTPQHFKDWTEPCPKLPGSAEKVECLIKRHTRKQALWNDRDAGQQRRQKAYDRLAIILARIRGNGKRPTRDRMTISYPDGNAPP